MSENANLIEYYKELLIMQYNDKPKAIATVDALVRSSMIFDLAAAVRDGYDIETAVGMQQDVLGKYLGANRIVTGTTFTRSYFGFSEYGDTAPFAFFPMLKYGEEAPDAQFRNYDESSQSLYALNDEEYRIIQKLAIVRNNSNASVKDIDDILYQLFGAECYFIDRMNMTVVSYMVGEKWSRMFSIAKSAGLLPNPAGVGTSLVVVPDINNIFSFSLYGGSAPAFAVGFIKYSEWEKFGNELSTVFYIPSSDRLDGTTVIVLDKYLGGAQAYSFLSDSWSTKGNLLPYINDNGIICSISSTRIVFSENTNNRNLYTYDFDGTDWTPVGNILNFPAASLWAIRGMATSRMCIQTGSDYKLQAYDFDGTDWTPVGSKSENLGGSANMVRLSDTDVAVLYDNHITRYSFDETDWIKIGDSFDTGVLVNAITSYSDNVVTVFANSTKEVITVHFINGEWAIGAIKVLTDIAPGVITQMDPITISVINTGARSIFTIKSENNPIGCMAKYS